MSEQNISPLRGFSPFAMGCYRHCAPTGLGLGAGHANEPGLGIAASIGWRL